MSAHKPIGGKLFSPMVLILGALSLIAFVLIGYRFVYGLGSVTNLTNAYPWGIWVVYDIVIGTAFACGGYALAITVYILNKGQYHPLVRPALLASLFGYALGGAGAFIDMGRYWNAYQFFNPFQQNFNSVMLEVGLCVFTYVLVLTIEFAPAVLEKFGMKNARAKLDKTLFFFIALGVVLPTMHQSSLGSLLISLGHKVTPLWQAVEFLPILALLSALTMGFSIVIFEASLATAGFRRPSEGHILSKVGGIIKWLLLAWLLIRFGELLLRGKLGLAFAGDLYGNMFLLETALFIIPLVILVSESNRSNPKLLLLAAVSMLFAGALYRYNAFLIGFNPGPGYSYFPSAPELLVTLGIVAFEIMMYIIIVRRFPVLHATKA